MSFPLKKSGKQSRESLNCLKPVPKPSGSCPSSFQSPTLSPTNGAWSSEHKPASIPPKKLPDEWTRLLCGCWRQCHGNSGELLLPWWLLPPRMHWKMQGAGFPATERKANGSGWSMERLNFQRRNRGPSTTAPHHEVLQLALSAWYLKEMGQAMELDKSQRFEVSLCSITFEFLPCYNRSLLAQLNWIPLFLLLEGTVSGALIFGPFPKAFSLHPSQQAPPTSLANHKKDFWVVTSVQTSAFTIWHSVGLGWQGIWLASQDLLYLIHCVSDLVGTPPLTCSHALHSTLWLVCCQLSVSKV